MYLQEETFQWEVLHCMFTCSHWIFFHLFPTQLASSAASLQTSWASHLLLEMKPAVLRCCSQPHVMYGEGYLEKASSSPSSTSCWDARQVNNCTLSQQTVATRFISMMHKRRRYLIGRIKKGTNSIHRYDVDVSFRLLLTVLLKHRQGSK